MQQRKILFGSMLIIMTLLIRGKAQEHQDAVDEYNVPKEIEVCLKSRPDLKISGQINPFYLSGDFDGDGKLDFAVQIDHSGKHGVAICLSSQKKPLVVGAGSPLVWPASQEWRFDAWSIVPKESAEISRPPKAKHDGILLDIKEAANGLLYWDGTALRWKQLSD